MSRPASAAAIVDSIVVQPGEEPALAISGPLPAGTRAPDRVTLAGERHELHADATAEQDRWRTVLPLRSSRWGGPRLAPPSGGYRLLLGRGTEHPVPAGYRGEPPDPVLLPGFARVGFETAEGVEVLFSAPLADSERGPRQQARLEAEYRATRFHPAEAVVFESFYGSGATCNPLAIDRELSRMRPELTRYWSVRDGSIAVPDGGIPLIEGSAQWWRLRGEARLLVVNDWLRKRHRRRRHQRVLQTWHGTMLKRLALNRPGLSLRTVLAILRERRHWDALLAQNPYSRRIFRRAYAYLGPIWEEGYPRNDVLSAGRDAGRIRALLGIPAGAIVLLYAPTWRDDRLHEVDHLDASRFAAELGSGYRLLVRGHPRSTGQEVSAENVMDVTDYPDVSELFLAADALITDYSSVMFDFSVTGKPILFFTPDLRHYRDRLRGFYFDFLREAPGPVARTAGELLAAVRDLDAGRDRHAEAYEAWRRRFNPRDDGVAARRVVQRLIDAGFIE